MGHVYFSSLDGSISGHGEAIKELIDTLAGSAAKVQQILCRYGD